MATGTSCPSTTFCRHLPEKKTVCFYLLSSMLNEPPKQQSFRLKVVEDLKLSYNRYRTLVSRWTWLPTNSSVTVFMHLLSNCGTKKRNYIFFKRSCWRPWLGSYRNRMSRYIFLPTTTRKNCLLPSAVKFVEWNTEAAIFSNGGCWGSKTMVR